MLAGLLMLCQPSLPAKTLSSKTIEDGGTGPYKAVMTVEEALPGFAVYRPADMKAAGATNEEIAEAVGLSPKTVQRRLAQHESKRGQAE